LVPVQALQALFAPVHRLLVNRYYIDYVYERLLVGGVLYGGAARILDLFDRYVVDGAVNGVARVTRRTGAVLRLAQSGQLQGYAAFAVAGLLVILGLIILLDP
jgi:NADH-quinone oxidoreductase subunit L